MSGLGEAMTRAATKKERPGCVREGDETQPGLGKRDM